MTQLLSLSDRPTAVLASNDLTAIGALRAINRAVFHVPRDISLVGFDDIELCQCTQPPLTAIRLSRVELGQKAFDALYRSLEGQSGNGEEITVSTTLVLRQSTATVNRAWR